MQELQQAGEKIVALEAKCAELEEEVQFLRQKNQHKKGKIKALRGGSPATVRKGSVFQGLSFAIEFAAGTSFNERDEINSLITDNGGTISFTVWSQTNFLVTVGVGSRLSLSSSKLRAASQYGVPVVPDAFLRACAQAQVLLPHSTFQVEAATPNVLGPEQNAPTSNATEAVAGPGFPLAGFLPMQGFVAPIPALPQPVVFAQPTNASSLSASFNVFCSVSPHGTLDLQEELAAYESDDEKPPQHQPEKTSWRDLLLRPEILRAIMDAAWEYPSEVQETCIPYGILGCDCIIQAQSGTGKTGAYVLSVLQQAAFDSSAPPPQTWCLVLCHTRELAFQISKEFQRLGKYLVWAKVAVVAGGLPEAEDRRLLANEKPNIVIGTPGRVLSLVKSRTLDVTWCRHFVVDECDELLRPDANDDVQQIEKALPREKQIMMIATTLPEETARLCQDFCHEPRVIRKEYNALQPSAVLQYIVQLTEREKNRRLIDLLDNLEFASVLIFVSSTKRAVELNKLLVSSNFPSMCVHSSMSMAERLEIFNRLRDFKVRIVVATNAYARGLDFERVTLVINYDFPESADIYLHRLGRCGRFGTKGMAISLIASAQDTGVSNAVQQKLEIPLPLMPTVIDAKVYQY